MRRTCSSAVRPGGSPACISTSTAAPTWGSSWSRIRRRTCMRATAGPSTTHPTSWNRWRKRKTRNEGNRNDHCFSAGSDGPLGHLRRDPLSPGHPAVHESAADVTGGVLVAGVGNMFLHDDGFGPEVARHLAAGPQLGPGVRVVDYGIRGMHLAYDLLAGVDTLVLVDTVPGDGGSAPGSIRVLQVSQADLDARAAL